MHDDTLQLILEVLVCDCAIQQDSLIRVQVFHRQVLVVHLLEQVLPRDVLLTVRLHVQVRREAAIVIHLVLLHRVKIELEALQLQEEHVRQALDRAPLQRVALHLALLTEVGIISLEHLALDERLEALQDRLLVLDLQWDGHERFFALAIVRAALADEFVGEDAVEEVLHDFLLLGALDQVFDPIDQHVKELVDISLNHWIYR